jgi:poly(A) polymerase
MKITKRAIQYTELAKKILKEIYQLPEVAKLFQLLLESSSENEIYLVGGAIRDIFLGRVPQDFDFVVSGKGIDFAKKFARRTQGALVILSLADDEARVVINKSYTFDFNGLQGKSLQLDLERRDFTINALAISLKKPEKIIDEFRGLQHLKKKLIVPVSIQSLKLDPLRILRAFRFALVLSFKLDPKIFKLTQDLDLSLVAPERIGYEFLRITESAGSFFYIKLMHRLGLLKQIFPLAHKLFEDSFLFGHSLRTYRKIEEILTSKSFFDNFPQEKERYFSNFPFRKALLKIAGLFHDLGKPDTQFFTDTGDVHFYGHDNLGAKLISRMAQENLRFSRRQTQMLRTLVLYHMRLHLLATAPVLTDRAIRRFFRDLGDEYFGLLILTYADGYATAKKIDHLERTITRMIEVKRADEAKLKVKRLITGDDLISWGYKPGPIFKTILQELEDLQLEGKITSKEDGYNYLKIHYPLTNY